MHLAHHDVRDGKKLTAAVRYTFGHAAAAEIPAVCRCVVLIASSCGLKGPLYRPDETKNETVAPGEDATEATKKKAGRIRASQPPAIDPDRPAVPPGR